MNQKPWEKMTKSELMAELKSAIEMHSNVAALLVSADKKAERLHNEWQEAHKELTRIRATAEQMRGFIRAHHSEKISVPGATSWEPPQEIDSYPFMEASL